MKRGFKPTVFISHDLRAVRHIADRIAVMYLGEIVELGASREVYDRPLMPYTRALISAVPVPDPEVESKRSRIVLTGDVPSPINPPAGCRFHRSLPVYSVQYHPEAGPGPHDAAPLFDKFVEMMERNRRGEF